MVKIHNFFESLSSPILKLIIVLVILELCISGFLIYGYVNLHSISISSHCWNNILNKAVHTLHPTIASRANLLNQAQHCPK